MSHVLRDKDYHRIGEVREVCNGTQEIRDASNHRLGYYDPDRDMTFDAAGHVVGHGNLLTTLLEV